MRSFVPRGHYFLKTSKQWSINDVQLLQLTVQSSQRKIATHLRIVSEGAEPFFNLYS